MMDEADLQPQTALGAHAGETAGGVEARMAASRVRLELFVSNCQKLLEGCMATVQRFCVLACNLTFSVALVWRACVHVVSQVIVIGVVR
jgi:hypothetical protein